MFRVSCLILCSLTLCSVNAAIFGKNLFTAIFLADGTRPTRVRTVEEVENNNGSGKFVILDFIGLVEQYEGYTAEEYRVTTDDDYILCLHRITGSPQSPKADNKPVVYLAHGLTGSSDFLVDLGPQKSIAFELADAGYDVWLGNVRGNTYSRAHVTLSPDEAKFWEFTMDEYALYDVSKFIDFALEKTGQQKLTYIGYSMGATLCYMLLAEKPEYNEKVNLLIGLGPAVYFLGPINLPLMFTLVIPLMVSSGFRTVKETLPLTAELASAGPSYCTSGQYNVCNRFFSLFTTRETFDMSSLPTILTYTPAGSSYYVIKHYFQRIRDYGKLRKYDYGCIGFLLGCSNEDHYNTSSAPEYDITKVTVPNVIFYGEDDFFVRVKEIEYLKNQLSNVVAFEKVADERFNHFDFIWSTEAKSLVYDRVLTIMSEQLK